MTHKLSTALCLTILIGCKEAAVDTTAEGEKLMQVSRDWSNAAATDSIDKTVSYWADDAFLLVSGEPALNGKSEIRQMVEQSKTIPGFKISWEPKKVVVSKSGDLAYMIEDNQVTVSDSTGKPVTTHGKGVTIWRKDSAGNWKNVVDVSVTDAPPKK